MSSQPSISLRQQSEARRRLLSTMTSGQLKRCRRDYDQHLATCAKLETAASSFDIFLIEWLECERGERANPITQVNGETSTADCQHRSYERMFEGKRGWD
jgi:hypothetical protein